MPLKYAMQACLSKGRLQGTERRLALIAALDSQPHSEPS